MSPDVTPLVNLLPLLLGAVLGGSLALSGCSDDGTTEPQEGHAVVVTWSEADSQDVDLGDLVGPDTVVIDTEADRDALLARTPDDLSTAELEAVDLTTHVVVAGGYHRCTQSSSIVRSSDAWTFVVDDGDPGVDCAWSPYTIDVWSVPRP